MNGMTGTLLHIDEVRRRAVDDGAMTSCLVEEPLHLRSAGTQLRHLREQAWHRSVVGALLLPAVQLILKGVGEA